MKLSLNFIFIFTNQSLPRRKANKYAPICAEMDHRKLEMGVVFFRNKRTSLKYERKIAQLDAINMIKKLSLGKFELDRNKIYDY